MNVSEATAFLTEMHEQRKLNTLAAIEGYFQDDAVFSIAGTPRDDSIAVQSDGKTSCRAALDALLTHWQWVDVAFKSVLTDGDQIVCRYDLTARHVPTGRIVTTEIVDFMRLKDGKIAELTQFTDTAHLSAVALGRA